MFSNIDDDDILLIKAFKFIQWIHWQLTIANQISKQIFVCNDIINMVLILCSKDKYLSHIEPIFKFMCYLVLDFSNILNAFFVKLYQMVFIILFFRGGQGGQGTKEHVSFVKTFYNCLRHLTLNRIIRKRRQIITGYNASAVK